MIAILFISLGLRISLVFSGGQFFWPDEERYFISRLAADNFLAGNFKLGLFELHTADHFLFKVIAVIPALLEGIFGINDRIPSLFFSLFSVINIWLLGNISRKLGANDREALLATLLLSLSSTFFFYSRHILPYDMSMTFALYAILIGITNPARKINSILCGLFSLGAFLVYNGYWVLSAFAFLSHVLIYKEADLRQHVTRAALFGIAFLAPLGLLLLASNLLTVEPLLLQFQVFSSTITHGVFSEGWSLPIEFFWHADHLLLIFWIASTAYCVWYLRRGDRSRQIFFGLAGVLFVYGSLFAFSVILEKFVVYGRLARQLIPFFSILGAYTLERLWTLTNRLRGFAISLLIILIAQAGLNFYPPLKQKFPADLRVETRIIRNSLKSGEYGFINAHFIHPNTIVETPDDRPYTVHLVTPHPLEYLPFQYQGYTPEKRNYLRANNISMLFVIYDAE